MNKKTFIFVLFALLSTNCASKGGVEVVDGQEDGKGLVLLNGEDGVYTIEGAEKNNVGNDTSTQIVTPKLKPKPKPIVHKNLLSGITARFSWQHSRHINDPRVKNAIQKLLRNKDVVYSFIERSKPYLYYVTLRIQAMGLPLELTLLPIIESNYSTTVVSRANAVGLWQIIEPTAHYLGMHFDWWFDERRDVLFSTDKALTYLRRLYIEFGDWDLALAAYNGGEGRVKRAIRRGGTNNYWRLRLPLETRTYVPKLLALVEILSHPDRYGVNLPHIPNTPYFKVHSLKEQINIKTFTSQLTRDKQQQEIITKLNAGYNNPLTNAGKPNYNRVLLPVEYSEKFDKLLAKSNHQKPSGDKVWVRKITAKKDTVNELVKDYQTTPEELKQTNRLSFLRKKNSYRLMLIPVQKNHAPRYEQIYKESVAKIVYGFPVSKPLKYRVRSGDSLWKISLKFNVSLLRLAEWNNLIDLDKPLIRGEILKIWPSRQNRIISALKKDLLARTQNTKIYTVKSGDSLWKIAKRFGVSIRSLKRLNGIVTSKIYPGQRLRLNNVLNSLGIK